MRTQKIEIELEALGLGWEAWVGKIWVGKPEVWVESEGLGWEVRGVSSCKSQKLDI